MHFGEWWRRLLLFLQRNRATDELREEMRLHRELRADSIRRSGASAPEATIAARLHFGNPVIQQEASRDMWGLGSLDHVAQDVRYALRRLRQRPGFTVAVVSVLALGIGATTAMFSAVDAAMLRPLPFPRPQDLVTLPQLNVPFDPGPGQQFPKPANHLLDVNDVIAMRGQFSHVAAWASGGLTLSDPEHPRRLIAGVVTVDFFNTLGVPAAVGRGFVADEGKPGGPRVVVLSDDLWQRQFDGQDMLQHTILLNDKPYLVVGIMPRGFSFPKQSDIWIPMSLPTTFETFEAFRGFLPSQVIARLAPGVTVDLASKQVIAQWQRGISADPTAAKQSILPGIVNDLRRGGAAIPLQQSLVGDRHTALVVLLGATGLLMLIACANVTNLLLSQAIVRRREIAVREILGATRARVVRQLLTESTLLALGGALLGLVLAPASLGLLRSLLPAALAGVAPVRLDMRVLTFAALLGLVTGTGFGLWPALRTKGRALGETIKAGGGHGTTSGGANRIRRGLVAAELALTLVLLVGASLMLRSFRQLMGLDRGMDTEHVGTLEMSFPSAAGSRAATLRLIEPVLERLQATPGVTSAGAVNDLPLGGGGGISLTITVDGAPEPKGDERPYARQLMASGNYFKAMGIPLLAGRSFTPADDTLAPPVAIISAGMAKAYWPGGNALGRTFRVFGPLTVIGVVADVREITLDRDPMPQMYFSIYAQTSSTVALVARGSLPPRALLAAMQAAVRAVDPSQVVYHVRTMDAVLSTSVAPRRTNALLISLFAGLALLLASLGVYAVVAHGVAQRSREFGIRSALGATGGDLLEMVGREMVPTVLSGVAIGVAGAWALARLTESLLYGVTAHDAATFIGVPALLLVPAAAATFLPARRAARVNPAEVMRAE
jgi:putative ABC transport system permease protein